MLQLLALAAAALLALAPTAGALPKVSRVGKYLYTEDGNRFFIKGIAYQTQGRKLPTQLKHNLIVFYSPPPVGLNLSFIFDTSHDFLVVDNLADSAACARDLPTLQKLGINAIRAYSANSSLNHDECMQALSSAGIYVILDLTLPLNGSIDTTLPAWSTNTLDQYLRTIDAFEKYDNVLAYNVGNEVMTPTATQAAPFLVAAARDIRAYLNSISSSALVGYAAIDGPASFVDNEADFLACSESASIDIFGLNNYEWCGNEPNTTFDSLNSRFANYGVAAYFSEFGSENCNPNPRLWTEIPVMFRYSLHSTVLVPAINLVHFPLSEPMTNVWSGGVAFSYFTDMSKGHDFGMAALSPDNSSVTTNADFDNLAAKFNAVTFVNSPAKGASTPSLPSCPSPSPPGWNASNTLPATPNDAACGCLANELSCVFTPPSPDYMVLVGQLIGIACGLVAQAGGTCDDISSNGVTGTYGRLAMCDPTIKLSYVMSQYYELNHRVNAACSFSGNATINASAKPSLLAAAAASSCIPSPAIFTPSAPPVLVPDAGKKSNSTSGGPTADNSGHSTNGGMSGIVVSRGLLVGVTAALGCVVGGMIWTLA
ncbi:1,3-beta-glucanosyltransferase [Mycena venus]|uniref:1,3-beta-glucanosyltransferase n=1 Tax=Mycena venus TaxID=2733690 RepID=A0A8H6Y1K5_9AGAR|nr:1,3-beta-glucanosyltransferase [Mycena venus]